MSLLRRSRAELAGAWRSLRYDMGRRPAEPMSGGGPDMTSTGMSTFGGAEFTGSSDPAVGTGFAGRLAARCDGGRSLRPNAGGYTVPRWAVAFTAFGALTMAGAAAAYLGVVHGVGAMIPTGPAAAGTFAARSVATQDARRGQGSAPRTPVRTTAEAEAPAPQLTSAPLPPPGTTQPRTPASALPTKPASPDCDCDSPPVPTPTVPTSPPSPGASPEPPSPTPPSPEPPSPTPPSPTSPAWTSGSWFEGWPLGGWPETTDPSPSEHSATPGEEDEPGESGGPGKEVGPGDDSRSRGRHRTHH